MKKLSSFLFASAFVLTAGSAGLAQTAAPDAMATHPASAMKPACAAGDPVVGVNTETKMYMTHDQLKAKMAGMTPDQMHAAMAKNNVKLMCLSTATKMGATPMTAAPASHM